MFNTSRLLDAAKSRQAIPSDYRLAKTLGVTQSLISGYRAGRSRPDDLIARRLAELAGLDADVVVVELAADRAQTPEARALWEGIADRLQKAGLAMITAVFALLISAWPDAGAQAATLSRADSAHSQNAIVESIHCRVYAALRRLAARLLWELFPTARASGLIAA